MRGSFADSGNDDEEEYSVSNPAAYRVAKLVASWGLPAYFTVFIVIYFLIGVGIYLSREATA